MMFSPIPMPDRFYFRLDDGSVKGVWRQPVGLVLNSDGVLFVITYEGELLQVSDGGVQINVGGRRGEADYEPDA